MEEMGREGDLKVVDVGDFARHRLAKQLKHLQCASFTF